MVGFEEFKKFLKEYKVLALAVAFVMGGAVNKLVQSLVDDIIMPVITPFMPAGAWEEATLAIGPIMIKWGSFLSALINFVILALIMYFMVRMFTKKEKKKK